MAECFYTRDPGSMMIRPRRSWTPEEDRILKQEVKTAQSKGVNVSWHEIAAFLPGRTNKDCRKRWYGTTAAKVKKGPWTEAEDDRLRKAIERHGTKWATVASVVGTRLPDQCSKRWTHAINPEIDHSPWTPQEDQMLIQNVNKHGNYWQQIVSLYFPGRTSLAAKNRYHILQRRLKNDAAEPVDGVLGVDFGSWQEVLWEHSRANSDYGLFPPQNDEPWVGMPQETSMGFQADRIDWLSMASHPSTWDIHLELMALSRAITNPSEMALDGTFLTNPYSDIVPRQHGLSGTSSPTLRPSVSCTVKHRYMRPILILIRNPP
ncbi:Homeodomain-like protein [Aspergillus heterothallicus]